MNRPHPRRGFTLLNLLVVVAIIGLLVALCCPPREAPAKRPGGSNA